ncbi:MULTISPECIES: 1-deoxy-D-xylulose-5-phosphate reductoisomerase [unclassified Acinetobacter]|uniref:1-deoxy-D-xylulose-5-phosphate reductoisomerase n=1 Tax=unclassified Acinetobacter TaxID=196816 RepID=UPI0035BB9078
MLNVSILGATGSIGQSTLRVIAQHSDKYQVFAVSAWQRMQDLVEICQKFSPKIVAIPEAKVSEFQQLLQQQQLKSPQIVIDDQGLIDIAQHSDVDIVMSAIVGAAGLLPTLAALKAAKKVLLANKEALVMSGDIMMQTAKQSGATLLPVDSEHNAIFQCLPQHYTSDLSVDKKPKQGVQQLLLTASGGPFLNHDIDTLAKVTPAQACKHPNWSMGQKISVDSATLMNKGLELIEACHLFSLDERFVQVVIHPQSIIHSMVQYVDGSTLAQMGSPDMCTPIAHALAYPERIVTDVKNLDLFEVAKLDFFAPDHDKFPALNLARQAMRQGGTAPAILNATNEIAVSEFLQGRLGFLQISQLVDKVLQQSQFTTAHDLDVILHADNQARHDAKRLASQIFA